MSAYVFNPQAKVFYRPIDAALRWCNLIHFETQIMQAAWSHPEELAALFPQWPGLCATTEKIYDAVRNGDLPYGCLGISVPLGSYVVNRPGFSRHLASSLRDAFQTLPVTADC